MIEKRYFKNKNRKQNTCIQHSYLSKLLRRVWPNYIATFPNNVLQNISPFFSYFRIFFFLVIYSIIDSAVVTNLLYNRENISRYELNTSVWIHSII